MEQGDQEISTTPPKGTKIYVEILGKKTTKGKQKTSLVNRMYYGFQQSETCEHNLEMQHGILTTTRTHRKILEYLNRGIIYHIMISIYLWNYAKVKI